MNKTIFFPILMLFLILTSSVPLWAAQSPQVPIAGSAIPQFQQPLPLLSIQPGGTMQTVLGNTSITLRMCEFKANVLPAGTVPNYAGTWVWGYLPDPDGTNTCSTLTSMYGDASGIVDTYIGPVIVSNRGSSTDVTYINDLGYAENTNVLAYKYATDQTIHWADPLADQTMANACMMQVMTMGILSPSDPCAQNYIGPIPAIPHLHGAEVPPEIDGSPDSWFTSDGNHFGHKYYTAGTSGNSAVLKYPNTQEAGPLWFHDHTLGATRLNVFAGLAGAYFIDDPAIWPQGTLMATGSAGTCTTGCLPANLQPINEVIPVVLQDRMFDTNGQLFYQSDSAGGILWATNPEHPYWTPEFVGDTIVVNGKAWPFLNVEAKRYRFVFLNGSNARTFELSLKAPMFVIGTDGGYLDAPVPVSSLTIMPGERYEVIIDFTKFSRKNLILNNNGRTPYPKGTPPQGSTVGRVMQFQVGLPPASADTSYDPATLTPLRSGTNAIVRLTSAGALPAAVDKTRAMTLNEVMGMAQTVNDPVTGLMTAYPGGPLEILVNNTKWSGNSPRPYGDFVPINVNGVITAYSENPREGDTEVWEIINLTADAHPIHLHLVQFQLINRQNFNTNNYNKAYAAAFPGGGIDPMTGLPYPAGVFMPAFGPPLDIDPANSPLAGGKFGGNPDVTPYLQGSIQLPLPQERGWKDTVIMYPGQVTRIAVRWAPTTLAANTPKSNLYYPFDPSGTVDGEPYQFNYVWHCHIIDHEDNEMMRPDVVAANTGAVRSILRGVDY